MTPIVFKMRHTDPRTKRRSTPQRNSSHIKYIGEREHALIAEKNTEHIRYIGEREHAALTQHNNGLFGKIRGEYSNSYATTDVQNYVRSMSTTHRNIYWSVYSFKPETAAEAGLHSLTDWENWVKQRIYEISDHLKIRYDDLEYIAAVHLKEAPPDPLLEKISQLVTTEAPLWEGTATTLAKLLDCNLTPNVLSRKLNINAARLKEEYNIRYERSHGHESRTITLTLCYE